MGNCGQGPKNARSSIFSLIESGKRNQNGATGTYSRSVY
jgi:hypothetical protein